MLNVQLGLEELGAGENGTALGAAARSEDLARLEQGRHVAPAPSRRRPTCDHVPGPAPGMYSSARPVTGVEAGVIPPATRTRPTWSSVAVCSAGAVMIVGAGDRVPVAGSYSSALSGDAPAAPHPPVTSAREI